VIALAAAAAVPGRSRLVGAAVEPSCVQQVRCLTRMGGRVGGLLPELEITGQEQYPTVGWPVAPDRIHAVTYLTAGLLTRGEVTVRGRAPLEIPQFVAFLRAAGARVRDTRWVVTAGFPESGALTAVDLDAGSEPRFSGAWAGFAALLLATRSVGTSRISDDAFLGRFRFVDNLTPFGLDNVAVRLRGRPDAAAAVATISGRPDVTLRGGDYGACPDIRGSAALALAALVADGPVTLADDAPLRRGYQDLPRDLRSLGVPTAYAVP
jgi:UDP-N-acetylglucosamine 1-carboxyvinyltransferase